MSEILKGVILTIEGDKDQNDCFTKARVQDTSAAGTASLPVTIPWYLRGEMGNLKKGTEVVFALFPDASGIILSRMDGNWSGTFVEKNLSIDAKGNVIHVNGILQDNRT